MNSEPSSREQISGPSEIAAAIQATFPFSILLCVWVMAVLTTSLVTFILPESYASTALVKLNPHAASDANEFAHDPYLIQKAFEVIQSEPVLSKVIQDLRLNTEWGKKYGSDGSLTTEESLGLLRARLDLRPIRSTSLIEIRVFSEKPDEAMRLANAVATTYREYHSRKQGAGSVEIVNNAVANWSPVRPNKVLNVALSLAAGACAGFILALLVHQARRLAGRPQAGSASVQLPYGLRAGVHFASAFAVGVIVGYYCAVPLEARTVIVVPFSLLLAALASAWIELARTQLLSAPKNGIIL